MATGAKVIQIYKKSTHKKQLDMICDNYNRLNNILEADVNGLIFLVLEDKAAQKREYQGDLGVRVQSVGHYSNPTMDQGNNEILIEQAITSCDFSSGIIEGIDHEFFVIDRAETHLIIKRDLIKFNKQLDCLQDEDRDFFLPYLYKKKGIDDLADEYGITYKSMQQRITRVKNRIDEGMHPMDYKV